MGGVSTFKVYRAIQSQCCWLQAASVEFEKKFEKVDLK